jgi:hypothetical protein
VPTKEKVKDRVAFTNKRLTIKDKKDINGSSAAKKKAVNIPTSNISTMEE